MTTIVQERALRASVGLILRTREQARLRFDYRSSRPVTEPAVADFNHISVTNPRNYGSNDAHWRAIENIGITRFPSTGISYNGGVLPGGVLYEGQPWGRRGAHTVNTREWSHCAMSGCPSKGSSIWAPSWNNNITGRALVFARNLADPVTNDDVDAAARYWAGHKLCGLLTKSARLHGHRCCSSKDCPGNRVWVRMDDIQDLTATYVRTGLPGIPPPPPPPPPPKPKGIDMFVTPYGSSLYRAVVEESSDVVPISQVGAERLKAAGYAFVALPAVDVDAFQTAFGKPDLIEIVDDEPEPPTP
jgi:hypothetical protein